MSKFIDCSIDDLRRLEEQASEFDAPSYDLDPEGLHRFAYYLWDFTATHGIWILSKGTSYGMGWGCNYKFARFRKLPKKYIDRLEYIESGAYYDDLEALYND